MPSPLVLFAGGRLGDFTNYSGGASEQGAGSGTFDTSWSDSNVSLGANVTCIAPFTDASGAAVTVTSGQKISVHGWLGASRNLWTGAFVLLNSSSQPWVRINCPSQGYVQLQYNSNTGASPTWTNLGPQQASVWGDYDISLDISAGGTHTVLFAVGGTTVFNGTFTNANLTNIAFLQVGNGDGGGTAYISQIIAARDMSLIGAKLKSLRATGAGTYAQWTGAYTNVNEVSTSDATYDVTTATGNKQSYNQSDVTLPAQYSIAGVFYRIRARNDGGASAAQNVQALARSGGTDYVSANLAGISNGYGYLGTRYDVDPATGVAWTQSGLNALELGYVSAA